MKRFKRWAEYAFFYGFVFWVLGICMAIGFVAFIVYCGLVEGWRLSKEWRETA